MRQLVVFPARAGMNRPWWEDLARLKQCSPRVRG